MENKEIKTNKTPIIIIISSLVAVSVFAAILTFFLPNNKECKDGEELVNGKCELILTPAEDIIETILNSNSYFQDSVGVGSTFSNLYHFKSDNTFSYSSKSKVTENDQAILMNGIWEYSSGKLTLNITRKTVAKNGTVVDDAVTGKTLNDYQTVTIATQETKVYNIISASDDGLDYITGDLILYKVNLDEDEINELFSIETSSSGVFNTVEDFVSEMSKYNETVKIINSESDLNPTGEYKTAYYKLNSEENIKKYSQELATLAQIGLRGFSSNPTAEEYAMLLYHRLVWSVDEQHFCIEKELMRTMILELYDKDLGKDFKVENYTPAGNYYCNGPGGGYGPGYTLVSQNEIIKDDTYTYKYIYASEDKSQMVVTVVFKKVGNLYKLKDFKVN